MQLPVPSIGNGMKLVRERTEYRYIEKESKREREKARWSPFIPKNLEPCQLSSNSGTSYTLTVTLLNPAHSHRRYIPG